MKHLVALCFVLAGASAAQAACYADYKARQDNPLQLHYGVVQLSDGACPSKDDARRQIARRIAADNWQLLTVMSLSTKAPSARQRSDAGRYFLRY